VCQQTDADAERSRWIAVPFAVMEMPLSSLTYCVTAVNLIPVYVINGIAGTEVIRLKNFGIL
jgi:hypothetical protein